MNETSGKVFSIEDSLPVRTPKKQEIHIREGGISANLTLFNLLKGMIGPGCFSLPLALKYAGLWTGFALIFIFGTITCISMMKLVKCSQYLSRLNDHGALDYGHMAEEACLSSYKPFRVFAVPAKIFVNICLLMLQFGICSVYYIFVAEHAREVVDYLSGTTPIPKFYYFFLVFLPFLLLCSIRNVKHMSYVSLLGNVTMVVSLVLIMQILVSSPHIINQLPTFTSVNGAIMAAGSTMYAFEGQSMVLPLENKMKYPSDMTGFTGVLSSGMGLVTIVYAACGFFGYIVYGSDVRGSITLNLPDSPVNFLVKALLLVVVFTGYLVQHYVVVEMVMPSIKWRLEERNIKGKKIMFIEYGLRFMIVIVSMMISILIPNLEDIIPLIGVSCGMLLAMVIPPILESITFLPVWSENNQPLTIIHHLIFNTMFVVIGLFLLFFGMYENVNKLMSTPEIH